MKRAKDVDGYIAGAPEALQSKLKQLRKIIKDCAPEAEEKISWGQVLRMNYIYDTGFC